MLDLLALPIILFIKRTLPYDWMVGLLVIDAFFCVDVAVNLSGNRPRYVGERLVFDKKELRRNYIVRQP